MTGSLLFGIATVFVVGVATQTLEEKMKNDPDISQFYALMNSSKLARVTLQYKPTTIFAPINAAFQKFDVNGDDKEALVLYHITSVPKTTEDLGSSFTSLNSEIAGNPPLWITHITGTYHDDVYINNARILVSQSNIRAGDRQVLHKIDEVLVPTRSPSSASVVIYNPTAWEFMESYESIIIQTAQPSYGLKNFRQKVQQNNKQDIYKVEGGHTFFIPIDDGFENNRGLLIDEKVIDGHVIPSLVLFTTPTKKDVPFQTLASGDNDIRVLISFTQEQSGNTVRNYVKSHTLFGDRNHTRGVVLAEILKPNIPVKNGVVHLIQKPLMIVDTNVKNLLEQYQEKDGQILSKFLHAIKQQGEEGNDFLRMIERSDQVTLFAPCNNALENDLTLGSILNDRTRFMDILRMHLVIDHKLYVDEILKNSRNGIHQAQSSNKNTKLYFNVLTTKDNRTLTVEGGGVNATVIQADLAATNGIIHVIDRVLGVPYTTVYEKLRTDPMIRSTFDIGNYQGFNYRLNDTSKTFTYFVPSEKAWKEAAVAYPSEVKKIFMRDFAYHALVTLEQHLVMSNEPYTMERIMQLSQNSSSTNHYGKRREVELPTIRGSLKIYVEQRPDHTYIINWRGEKIPVFRANVECTNGIIHVIDAPFLRAGDIQVSKAAVLAPQVVMVLLAKILLL